jgi:hypothetical protein
MTLKTAKKYTFRMEYEFRLYERKKLWVGETALTAQRAVIIYTLVLYYFLALASFGAGLYLAATGNQIASPFPPPSAFALPVSF